MDKKPISAPLVGRESEIRAFHSALDHSIGGTGKLLLLAGEAGIGKSHLARAFHRAAVERGAQVLWGHCFEGNWQPPFAPWAEVLREFLVPLNPLQIQAETGTSLPYLARILPELAEWTSGEDPVVPLSADEERFRIFDAISRWLLNSSRQRPLVIILDDLHWADTESLLLLRYLVRFVRRSCILIVGIYRTPDLDFERNQTLLDTLAMLTREESFVRFSLRGLAPEEVQHLLTMLGRRSLPEALSVQIYQLTEGNPFFTQELFQHLLEEGRIFDGQGAPVGDQAIVRWAVPQGVRDVLRFRMNRLSEETNHMMHLCAVLTGGFHFHLLSLLSGLEEEALLRCLDEALASGLIRAVNEEQAMYDFSHAIVRHTIYEQLNPDRRLRLHRQAAEVFEKMVENGAEHYHGELAAQYHASRFLQGAERGIRHALEAAEEARRGFAHQRSAHFYRLASELAAGKPAEELISILTAQAYAEAAAMEFYPAAETARSAAAKMVQAGVQDGDVAAFLTSVISGLKEAGAPSVIWNPLMEECQRLVGSRRDRTWARLQILSDRWEKIQHEDLHYARWLGCDPQAVQVLQASGEEDDFAQTLEPFDWRSREEVERILAAAQGWKNPAARMRAVNVAGRAALFYHAAFAQAENHGSELLLLSTRTGSLVGQAEALVLLAAARAAQGKLDLAQRTAAAAHELVARLGEAHRLHVVIEAALAGVLAYYLDTDWPRLVERSLELVTGPAEGRWGMFGLYFPAFATIGQARTGQGQPARVLLEKLLPLLEQVDPYVIHMSISVHAAGSAVWELNAVEYADRIARLAQQFVQAGVGDSQIGSSQLCLARMFAMQSSPGEAARYFDLARQHARNNGQQAVLAIIDYDQALSFFRSGGELEEAERLVSKALAAFGRLGMPGWKERTGQLRQNIMAGAAKLVDTSVVLPDGLTAREAEVLTLIARGLTNKEIGEMMAISIATVERHISNLYRKIKVRGRAEAVSYAMKRGLAGDG